MYCYREPELIVPEESYHWLADKRLLNQRYQPQLLRWDFWVGCRLNGNREPLCFTSDVYQAESGSMQEESRESKKDEEEKRIEREDHLVYRETQYSQSWEGN